MSKDTPETGDVFQFNLDNDIRIHIINRYKNTYDVLVSDKLEVWNVTEWIYCKDKYKYIGKSKARVYDLFKTENNVRCIEDNAPHLESTVLFKEENQ